MKLDLGCGPGEDNVSEFLGVDLRVGPKVDIVADLSAGWPFKDGAISEVRASHIVEHLPEPLHTMSELFRVLEPGGTAVIDVPSTNGMGAFQDPTHVSYWNINSFIYYDHRQPLGGMYGCNKWEIKGVQEYNLPGVVQFGPYVKAVVQKPEGEPVCCK